MESQNDCFTTTQGPEASEPCIRYSGNRNETRNPADWACEIRTRFALQRVCAGIVLYTVSPGRAGAHGVAARREGLVRRS